MSGTCTWTVILEEIEEDIEDTDIEDSGFIPEPKSVLKKHESKQALRCHRDAAIQLKIGDKLVTACEFHSDPELLERLDIPIPNGHPNSSNISVE